MPRLSCVNMKIRRPERVQARVQVYPRFPTRQHRKNASSEPSSSMDEADVQLHHEFNHATAEASSEEEMASPLGLSFPHGPLDALRG